MIATRALERLYAASPNEFTRTRNSLVAELRKSHDADAAREIARLRRPSAALWAVNQLARHARAPLEGFLEAVDRLRRTQLSDPRGAMEAMRAQRAQLETLVQRAGQALEEAGYSVSADTRRRIGDTLLGAAADRYHAQALARGRLTVELHAPGFDALTGAPRLRVLEGGAAQRDGAVARDDARARARDAKATANARASNAKAVAREQKARERAARAEERRRETDERRRETDERRRETDERQRETDERRRETDERRRETDERRRETDERRREAEARRQAARARAEEIAALQREAATARERLAEVQRRLKAARRGRTDRTR